MRLIVWIAAVAGLIRAQNQPSTLDPSKTIVAIQGVVVDKDSHAPIAGASVTVLTSAPNGPSVDYSGTFAGAKAGPSGDFRAEVYAADSYTVAAQANGYERGQALVTGLAPGQSSAYVQVTLRKLGTVSGTLVDDDTREPITGLSLELIALAKDLSGEGITLSGAKTVTGADGSFTFPDVSQGEHFMRISAKPAPAMTEIPAKDLQSDNREKALEPPEGATSYGTTVWPGHNADFPSTQGFAVGSAPLDLGEIRLPKVKLQNVTGIAESCEDGAKLQITLSRPSPNPSSVALASQEIACGSGFSILNLPDGTFTLTAMQGFPQRRWVSQSIDAHTKSPLRLNLAAFVTVQISVEMEGATVKDLPSGLRLNLEPQNRSAKVDSPSMLRPGAFEATLYPGERYFLSAQLPKKYYVKRISYDGAGLPDVSAFTASVAPLSQLSIVLSDQAGSIKVMVTSGANPPKSKPAILAWREGMSFVEFSRHLLMTSLRPAGADGTTVFEGLAPGRYHVAVLSPAQPLPTTEALFQALSSDSSGPSAMVTVDEGQTAIVTLDVP